MQAYKITKKNISTLKKSLHRGSIFRVDNISFDVQDTDGQLKKASIKDFYPHIKLDGLKYAVVLNHSCSLSIEHKPQCSTPYINIGFLEPLERLLKKNFTKYFGESAFVGLEKDHDLGNGKSKICFYDLDQFSKKLKENLNKIFQNTNEWYFFVAIGSKNPELFVLNLLKTVPLKSNHYSAIFNNVKYQLNEEFADSLGWKIAELYGKVGTTDYSTEEMTSLVDESLRVINEKILADYTIFSVNDAILKESKALKSSKTAAVIDFLSDKNLLEIK